MRNFEKPILLDKGIYGTLIPLILNLLVPMGAQIHYFLVFALRFLMGFFGGVVYPALQAMMARWVPPGEKGMFAWTSQGGPLGAFAAFSLCGFVVEALGWQYGFYITSLIIFMFYLLWICLTYNTPNDHPTISDEEKQYILSSLGSSVGIEKVKNNIQSDDEPFEGHNRLTD